MTNRMLTEEEKTAAYRVKQKMLVEAQYQEYLKNYAQLMLDIGLEQNYLKQRREYEQKLKDADNLLVGAQESIKIIDDQLTNGVEIKENTDDVDE